MQKEIFSDVNKKKFKTILLNKGFNQWFELDVEMLQQKEEKNI